MKPTPLLDFWEPPEGAGPPVAALATTFVLEPDFFERDCLARFLSLETIDEESGSASDTLAKIELEEKLAEPSVSVLADRSTRADRTSLRWDLLHCHVPGALLHAKVAVLIWENATRVLLGSANLTSAGYRRQIELGMAADLGASCIFTPSVLQGISDELESYVLLIPGQAPNIPPVIQIKRTIELFRERIAKTPAPRASDRRVRVALAKTSPGHSPIERLGDVWEGPKPLRATHLSPFWDSSDTTVLKHIRGKLTGHGHRTQSVATVLSPSGAVPLTPLLRGEVDELAELRHLDQELRLLHAKCLLIESDRWIAALVGSSNHTKAGLGLGGNRRHRELNVWLGAAAGTADGKALAALVAMGKSVPIDAPVEDVSDEDELAAPSLPLGFALCRLNCDGGGGAWQLHMQFAPPELPPRWSLSTTSGTVLLTDLEWQADGGRDVAVRDVPPGELPTFLEVRWGDDSASWTVVADDRHDLPPGPGVSDLKAYQLFAALTAGKSITAAMRDELARKGRVADTGPVLDPLKRFDNRSSLLRRGRALSAALAQMQRRLGRPVLTLEGLDARLASPLGPQFVALKVCEAVTTGEQSQAEGLFTLAELTLTVGRVDWSTAFEFVDRKAAVGAVLATIDRIDDLRGQLGNKPPAIAAYAVRATGEARRCLEN